MSEESADTPVAIRVLGPATSEDVAAIVALLAGTQGSSDGAGPDDRDRVSTWASHRALLRGRHDPGPSAWQSTFRG